MTRIGEVKPLMEVACYTCDDCGYEIYQEVTGDAFMPLLQCPTSVSRTNRTAGVLHLQTRASKFVKYQEIKLQELPNQVPVGHIPRSLTVVVHGELTRLVTAGDVVSLSGIFVPTPFTGFRQIRAGLITDTYVKCTAIERHKKNYSDKELFLVKIV